MKLKTKEVPLNDIELGGPVKNYNYHTEDSVKELAQNMDKFGLINPIMVWFDEDADCYRIAAGERRFRAARQLGWDKIEAKILTPKGKDDILARQISENRIREYDYAVESLQIYELMAGENKTNESISKLFGLSEKPIRQRRKVGAMLSKSNVEHEDLRIPKYGSLIPFSVLVEIASAFLRYDQDKGQYIVRGDIDRLDFYLKYAATGRSPNGGSPDDPWLISDAKREMAEYRYEQLESQIDELAKEKSKKEVEKEKKKIKSSYEKKFEREIEQKERKLKQLESDKKQLEKKIEAEKESEKIEALKDALVEKDETISNLLDQLEELDKELEEIDKEKEREMRKAIRDDIEADIEKEKEKLEEKGEELKERKKQLKKKEQDLKQRVLKPASHQRRIVKHVQNLRDSVINVHKSWLRLLTEDELNEMKSQFSLLVKDLHGVKVQIEEVQDATEKT